MNPSRHEERQRMKRARAWLKASPMLVQWLCAGSAWRKMAPDVWWSCAGLANTSEGLAVDAVLHMRGGACGPS